MQPQIHNIDIYGKGSNWLWSTWVQSCLFPLTFNWSIQYTELFVLKQAFSGFNISFCSVGSVYYYS